MKTLIVVGICCMCVLQCSDVYSQTSDFHGLGHVVNWRVQGLNGGAHLVTFQGQGQTKSDSNIQVHETFAFNSAQLSYPTFSLDEAYDTFSLNYSYNSSPNGEILSRSNNFTAIADESKHEILSISASSNYYSLNQSIGERKTVEQEVVTGRFPYKIVDTAGQRQLRVSLRGNELLATLGNAYDSTYSLRNLVNPHVYALTFQSGIDSLFLTDSSFLELTIGGPTAAVSAHSSPLEILPRPNPFNSNLNLKFNIPRAGLVQIELRNQLGMIVFRSSRIYDSGVHDQWIDASELPAGVYYYSVRTGTSESRGKAVKLYE